MLHHHTHTHSLSLSHTHTHIHTLTHTLIHSLHQREIFALGRNDDIPLFAALHHHRLEMKSGVDFLANYTLLYLSHNVWSTWQYDMVIHDVDHGFEYWHHHQKYNVKMDQMMDQMMNQ